MFFFGLPVAVTAELSIWSSSSDDSSDASLWKMGADVWMDLERIRFAGFMLFCERIFQIWG